MVFIAKNRIMDMECKSVSVTEQNVLILSEYMRNVIETSGLKLLLDQNETDFNHINANVAQNRCEMSEAINTNLIENVINNEIPQIDDKKIEISDEMQTYSSNIVKSYSPEPSPRVMQNTLNSKPEVLKNKPQIIIRKHFSSNESKTLKSLQIDPSEPLPPPLPESSPPASPDLIPEKYESIFNEKSNSSLNSSDFDQKIVESKESSSVPEDEYLLPNPIDTKHSSTISTLSFSPRDGDSRAGAFHSLSSQTLSKISLLNNNKEDYETHFEKENDYEILKHSNYNEGNYDEANNYEFMNSNDSNNMQMMDPRCNSKRNIPLPTLPQTQTFTGNESLLNFKWFHNIEREDAEALLMTMHENGSYLVRESERAGKSNPYTLCIFHGVRVFHLNIRKRRDGLYALGKEKPREKTFKLVAELIEYHKTQPILLTSRGTPAGKTRLIMTPMS